MPSTDEITAGVAEGSLVHRIAVLSLGLFAIVSFVRHRDDGGIRIDGPLGWILLTFAVWALVSPIWASDLALTLRRLVIFAIFCIAAVAVARRLSSRELVLWTFFSTTLFLAVGVFAELFLGTFRPFASGYRFAGTLHPNVQGVNCALLVLSGVAAADVERHRRPIFRIGAVLGFVFLNLTVSRTALAASLLALAAYFGVTASRAAKIVLASALSISPRHSAIGSRRCAHSRHSRAPLYSEGMILAVTGSMAKWALGGMRQICSQTSNYWLRLWWLWDPERINRISGATNWGVGAALIYVSRLPPSSRASWVFMAYILALLVGIWCAFRFHRLSPTSGFAFCGVVLLFARWMECWSL